MRGITGPAAVRAALVASPPGWPPEPKPKRPTGLKWLGAQPSSLRR